MTRMSWKSFESGIIVGSVVFSTASNAAPKALKLIVNGSELHMGVPAQIIDGNTMIPARALAEALGALVTWDSEDQAVIVESNPFSNQNEMDARRVVQLAGFAKKHYWTMSIGGKQHPEGVAESFTVQGKQQDYRWLGTDLDRKAKLTSYLEGVFAPERVASFLDMLIKTDGLVEINGKLAQVTPTAAH